MSLKLSVFYDGFHLVILNSTLISSPPSHSGSASLDVCGDTADLRVLPVNQTPVIDITNLHNIMHWVSVNLCDTMEDQERLGEIKAA